MEHTSSWQLAAGPTPVRGLFSGRWAEAEHRMTADRLAMIT